MKFVEKNLASCFLALAFIGCSENTVAPKDSQSINGQSITITAKWNIVYDSSTAGCMYSNYSVYKGKAGDYFDFRSDGNVYAKEGSVLDTMTYKVYSDTAILISSFGLFNKPSIIKKLTANQAIIFAPNIINPCGNLTRTLSLSR
jgi:hypothetical protein